MPRRDAGIDRRHADRPDDLRSAARGVRVGAVRDGRGVSRRDDPDRLRRPRRPTVGPSPGASRRADLHRRADPPRRVDHRRVAVPRHAHRNDRCSGGALHVARRAGRARSPGFGRHPAVRRLRHLDARARRVGGGARRRRDRRLARGPGRRGRACRTCRLRRDASRCARLTRVRVSG